MKNRSKMEVFEYRGVTYPEYIRDGNHAQYAGPLAQKVCKGDGIDVGANNEYWKFGNSKICDLTQPAPWNDGLNLPVNDGSQDYVFSSHCLEHIHEWGDALKEWTRAIKTGGILFLYLPHWDCEYWRVSNNPKHYNNFSPEEMRYTFENLGYKNVFVSGIDLSYSFMIFGEKDVQQTP